LLFLVLFIFKMSSSSSLSGARRRRAGGGSGPTSTSTQQQQPRKSAPGGMKSAPGGMKSSSPPMNVINQGPVPVPSPFQILQQHQLKLDIIEETIRNIVTTKDEKSVNPNEQINIDVEKVSNFVLENVEKQLDFKVFYENDEKLMNEIESLKVTLQSQQLLINELNTALYSIITKLNISLPNISKKSIDEDEPSINENNQPTFPNIVNIDEVSLEHNIILDKSNDDTNNDTNTNNDVVIPIV